MQISTKNENGKLTIFVSGRMDTVSAPELEQAIKSNIDDAQELVLDLSEMSYTSSAGLRVLLVAHKLMSKKGGMTVTGVNESVMEVLEITGFSDILDIK